MRASRHTASTPALSPGRARCSTVGPAEAGYSLEYQRDLLVKAGVDPEHIFEDACSGVRSSRPGFDKLMAAVREGDTVVVFRLAATCATTWRFL